MRTVTDKKSRHSQQRQQILEALRSVRSHPTANQLYDLVRERLPRVSLGTIYRNLEQLADSGQIQKLDGAGSQRHYDGNAEQHLHVRCRICDCIADVDEALNCTLPAALHEHEQLSNGFIVEQFRLELVGVCRQCQDSCGANGEEF